MNWGFYVKNKYAAMLIGGDFNKKAKILLKEAILLCDKSIEKQIAVEDLVSNMDLDKGELKYMLEYLENKGLIKIATIGGTFLYGHIYITPKGLEKGL